MQKGLKVQWLMYMYTGVFGRGARLGRLVAPRPYTVGCVTTLFRQQGLRALIRPLGDHVVSSLDSADHNRGRCAVQTVIEVTVLACLTCGSSVLRTKHSVRLCL